MAEIKLANGREVKELRVWDGVKWVAKRGRIFNGEKWIDFIRPPLSFKDDFITTTGMTRQTAKTLVREPVSVGQRTLLVQNATGFNVGDEITITDGINSENVKVVGRNLVLNSNYLPMNGSDNGNHNLTLVKQDENGEDYFSVIPINNGNIYWNKGIRFSEPRYEGEIYTLSFDIMTTQDSNWGFYFYTNGAGNLIVRNIPSTNGKWERFTYTFIQEVTKDDNILFGFHQLIAGKEVGWRKLKLEKGNKATLWTPAPEDVYGTADNVLSITPTKNSYKRNSIVARTNAVIENNKLVHSVHKTYSAQ